MLLNLKILPASSQSIFPKYKHAKELDLFHRIKKSNYIVPPQQKTGFPLTISPTHSIFADHHNP